MYIGIDIGGTNIRVGAFKDLSGEAPIKTYALETENEFEGSMKSIISSIKESAGESAIKGIGIGIPGDSENGVVQGFDNMPTWNGKSLSEAFSEFETKIKITNDAQAAALGESLFGHGKDLSKFLFIIWGTGWGGTYVQDGRFLPIEPGHQIIETIGGNKCTCGQNGCLESYVGGKAIAQYYKTSPDKIDNEVTWEKIAKYAALGLHNTLAHFYESEAVVFGGGLIRNRPFLIDKVKNHLGAITKYFEVPQITLSKLGEHTALYGAVGLFKAQ